MSAAIVSGQLLKIGADVDVGQLSSEYQGAVFVPTFTTPATTVDACYVRAVPGMVEAVRQTLPAALVSTDPESTTVVGSFLVESRFSRDWESEFTGRTTRWLPVGSGLALGLLWIIVRLLRRSHDGLYDSLGARVPERGVIRSVEWLLGVGVGSLAGALVAMFGAGFLGIPSATAVTFTVRAIILSLGTGGVIVAFSLLVPIKEPLAVLKDR
jgi:hypothetical protein